MTTATEAALAQMDKDRDERELNRRVKWFVEKWAERLDASRETHALLTNALAAMPPSPIILQK